MRKKNYQINKQGIITTTSLPLALSLMINNHYEIKCIEKNDQYYMKSSFQNMLILKLRKEGVNLKQIKQDIRKARSTRQFINHVAYGNTLLNIINTYFIKAKKFKPLTQHEIDTPKI